MNSPNSAALGPRAHFALKQAETLAQNYRDKLADIEALIQAIAPDLQLPSRSCRPNPIFARGELRRLAIDMLREAGTPARDPRYGAGRVEGQGCQVPGPARDEGHAGPIAGGVREATGQGRGADCWGWEGNAAGVDMKNGNGRAHFIG